MQAALRAGIAIYNAGRYHAAHDAWEDRWLELERDTDDERFLHGLIQHTAAIHHARGRNWAGATGLADSAREYLAPLPATYRSVDVGAVRAYLSTLGDDPEVIERRAPPALTWGGRALTLADLGFEATTVAAGVIAEESETFEEAVVDRAIEYARSDLKDGDEGSPFVALLFDFVREADDRSLVYRRLADHVDRRRQRNADVEGLFDE